MLSVNVTVGMYMSVAERQCSVSGLYVIYNTQWGRDSSVGIATRYGLDGPGSNPGGGEIFRTHPDRPWGPTNLLYNGYQVLPGDKAAGAWH